MRSNFLSAIPPVTKNLIIINVIVWLVMMVVPGKLGIDLTQYAGLHYFRASDFNPAQLVTYMFMHSTSSFAHIAFNMFSLWMFGSVLERHLGSAKFLFYYISCGIGAALIQELAWAWTWEEHFVKFLAARSNVDFLDARELMSYLKSTEDGVQFISQFLNKFVTIGASGAVYGILLAFGMLFPDAPLYLFFIPIPVKAKYMVIGMGVLEVLIGLSTATSSGDGVAHFAHMGGMVFGFFIIWYWKQKAAGRFR